MSESNADPTGTLILADEPARPLRWHHSVEFDGYTHTTACGRVLDTSVEIRDVLLDPVRGWAEHVKPANGCPICHDSVRGLNTNEKSSRVGHD